MLVLHLHSAPRDHARHNRVLLLIGMSVAPLCLVCAGGIDPERRPVLDLCGTSLYWFRDPLGSLHRGWWYCTAGGCGGGWQARGD